MNPSTPADPRSHDSQVLWCVYDRHLDPLYLAASMTEAEEWATGHWRAAEIAKGDDVLAPHHHSYLLSAVPKDAADTGRAFLDHVIRRDEVNALRRTQMDTAIPPRPSTLSS